MCDSTGLGLCEISLTGYSEEEYVHSLTCSSRGSAEACSVHAVDSTGILLLVLAAVIARLLACLRCLCKFLAPSR